MNDGNLPLTQFKENIRTIIETARKANSNCEFILIATMLPNKEALGFFQEQPQEQNALIELSKEYEGIAVANMTTMHQDILMRKSYCDITGNNINHPNDFMSRVYAQVILETINGEPEISEPSAPGFTLSPLMILLIIIAIILIFIIIVLFRIALR